MEDVLLEKYKKILLKEKTAIIEKMLKDNESYTDLDSREIGDLVDQTYRYYEKEMLMSMSAGEKETIQSIDDALDKIKAKTYGKCEECKGEIDEKRLEAIPYARQCIACKQKKRRRF
jgi:DnaK suppressor protein